MRCSWLVPVALALSCGPAPAATGAPRAGAIADFVERAQPVLSARCSNPGCHGNADRPLSLFAVHRHRAAPEDTFLDAPLTADEQQHNFEQASAFLVGVERAEESLLVLKPLSRSAGGAGHQRFEVFSGVDEHDYRQLLAWVELALESTP